MIMSPFTTAAVGIGVGDGGKGVLVAKIGEGVTGCESALPPHPLIRIVMVRKARIILLVFILCIICVDYKRFQDTHEGNLYFPKITV